MVQTFVSIFTDPETRALVNQYTQAVSGESFDDMLKEIGESLGVNFGSLEQ